MSAPTTDDLSTGEELIARGQPARDIAAELGVDSIEELRAFAIADDRARDGRHPMTITECPTGTESQL